MTAPRLAAVSHPTPIIVIVAQLEIGRRGRRIGQISARKTGVTAGNARWRHLPAACILESRRCQAAATVEGIIPYACNAVAAMSYAKYKRQTTIGGFTTTNYIHFFEIADGIRKVPQYFDPNTNAKLSVSYCVLI